VFAECGGLWECFPNSFTALPHDIFQHIGDRLAMISDRQRFRIVSATAARVALNPHVGQEVHFNANFTVSFAGFTPPPGALKLNRRGK